MNERLGVHRGRLFHHFLYLCMDQLGLSGATSLDVHPGFSVHFEVDAVPLQIDLADFGEVYLA